MYCYNNYLYMYTVCVYIYIYIYIYTLDARAGLAGLAGLLDGQELSLAQASPRGSIHIYIYIYICILYLSAAGRNPPGGPSADSHQRFLEFDFDYFGWTCRKCRNRYSFHSRLPDTDRGRPPKMTLQRQIGILW